MFSFIRNSFKELSKVSWPTVQQTVNLTVFVVIFTVICSVLVGATDYVLNTGYQQVVDFSLSAGLNTGSNDDSASEPISVDSGDITIDGGSASGQPLTIHTDGEGGVTVTPSDAEQPAESEGDAN